MTGSDTMRTTVFATMLALAAGAPSLAHALGFPGTCRGPGASITSIEGLDTPRARATAQYTVPDAVSQCHYDLGRSQSKPNPGRAAMAKCVDEFMRNAERDRQPTAEANCKAGTLRINGGELRKLPLDVSCAAGGSQGPDLFQILCPSYEGKVKDTD